MILFLRKNSGWLIVLFLAFLPAIRWAMILPLEYRFFDFSVSLTSFGQIAGLVGMAMFSLSMILSARLKFLDNFFSGLDKVYQHHHIIGIISFILLLLHPFFLVFQLVIFSWRDAVLFFLPSENWMLNFGIISFFSLIILKIMTLCLRLEYQRWKFFHSFLAIVFVFAIGHSFLAVSDIYSDNILRFYMFCLAGVGLLVHFYKIFLKKYFDQEIEYEIVKIKTLSSDIFELEMVSSGNKILRFEPGQFIFIRFVSSAISAESHPFSLVSCSVEKKLRLAIKNLGDFTEKIKNLKPGDKALVEGPFGGFLYKKAASKNQIWIAGGIGITPFLSMSEDLRNDKDYKIDLYYAVKNSNEAIFLEQLNEISLINKNFKVIPWYSEQRGRLSGEIISLSSKNIDYKDIFICGPPVFMESLIDQFRKIGIKTEKIHWENFNFKLKNIFSV